MNSTLYNTEPLTEPELTIQILTKTPRPKRYKVRKHTLDIFNLDNNENKSYQIFMASVN